MLNRIRAWRRFGPTAADAGGARAAAAALAVVACCCGAGCLGTVGAEGAIVYGHPVVRAEVVPVQIAEAPRVYYRGSYAYLIDGRWYYATPQGWVIFREEPVELRRYRTSVRPAPRRRAPTEYGYPPEPPPRRREHYR